MFRGKPSPLDRRHEGRVRKTKKGRKQDPNLEMSIEYKPSVMYMLGDAWWWVNYVAEDAKYFFDGYDCLARAVSTEDWTNILTWTAPHRTTLSAVTTPIWNTSTDLFDAIDAGIQTINFSVNSFEAFSGYGNPWAVAAMLPRVLDAYWRLYAAIYFA